MKFKYDLIGTGWAECCIEFESKKYIFTPSYLSDSLGDLLQALVHINPLYTENEYKKNGISFFWDEEPRELEWRLHYIDDDRLKIELIIYEDFNYDKYEDRIQMNVECSYEEFLGEVISAAQSILFKYGIVGYKEMWNEHNFPLSEFLKLKYYLEHRSEFPLIRGNEGSGKITSNFDMEISFLLNSRKMT